MFSTGHILTFPSTLTSLHENSEGTTKKMTDHFFFHGPKSESNLHLYVSQDDDQSPILARSDHTPFKDQVYFPELEEDFMLTIACLRSWFRKVDASGKMFGTVGYYYQIYIGKIYDYVKFAMYASMILPDAFAVKLLVHWSICFASHLSEIGRAGAFEVLEFFVMNIQRQKSSSGTIGIDFKPLSVPLSLSQFLERVEVPYLFPGATQDCPIVQRASEFIKMGNSYLPAETIGWGVAFEARIKEEASMKECYVECKLWTESVGIPKIYKYYEKACKAKHPISILVAKSFQESLEILGKTKTIPSNEKSEEAIEARDEDEKDEEEPLVFTPQAVRKSGRNIRKPDPAPLTASKRSKKDAVVETPKEKGSPAKTDYIDSLEALWNDPCNHINLYTIKYDESDFSFKCTALKEFDDPVGVFLVVTCNFMPKIIP